jgi:hypothetical protein
LGQYFTTNAELKEKVYEFIQNSPSVILEPSVDARSFFIGKMPGAFDMHEIDTKIKLLDELALRRRRLWDFMEDPTAKTKTYATIVGNPPFVWTKRQSI